MKEIRYLGSKPEIRAADGDEPSRTVEGYALLFDKESRVFEGMYGPGWVEVIDRKALDSADLTEVVARTHHDDRHILARTESKTLNLTVDEKGLKYRFDAPNTTAGNDLLEDIRTGNITESSFAFSINYDEGGEKWEDRGKDTPALRTVTNISKIYDVAPVVTPAYKDTKVGLRGYEQLMKGNDQINIKIKELELLNLKK